MPAVRAYRRMGFVLCGLDTSLYEFTASAGEYALYMRKPCRPHRPALTPSPTETPLTAAHRSAESSTS
ncbi:hypothetical protein GCM10018773_28520 [Streptomyces candidus]|nr:hypothetical protein GCM10018773_28520 [Streptomyces candidus]